MDVAFVPPSFSILIKRVLLFGILLMPASVLADDLPLANQNVYLDELIRKADELKLAQDAQWLGFLHVERQGLVRRMRSNVQSPHFFAAEKGAIDPWSELQATLASFFSSAPVAGRDEPGQCRWVARYHWLKTRLAFDSQRLPLLPCESFTAWQAGLDIQALHIVFASAYLNNPSSMFGHTLLRLDSKQNSGSPLLSQAINFSANTRDEQGAVFAWKGLTGGYAGRFGLFPYYQKVRDYARIDNRDLWEYPLKLEPRQIAVLLQHLWELRDVDFRYYFLRENCSLQLLALLQVALGAHALTDNFRVTAEPVNTLRSLDRLGDLLGKPVYRPALATRLAAERRAMPPTDVEQIDQLARGEVANDDPQITKLPERQQARLLQAAQDLAYYRKQIDNAESAVNLLQRRSQLPSVQQAQVAEPAGPLEGHETARLSLAVATEGGKTGLNLRIRPAYHDLMDFSEGYEAGAQIEFFDVGLVWDFNDEVLRLRDLELVSIQAISPRNDWFKPISWQLSAGMRRRPYQALGDAGELGGYVQGGPGLAWEVPGGFSAYGFAVLSADAGSHFRSDYSAGGGVTTGLLGNIGPGWRMQLEAGAIEYRAGDDDHDRYLSWINQWRISRDFSLRLDAQYRHYLVNPRSGEARISGQANPGATRGATLALIWYF